MATGLRSSARASSVGVRYAGDDARGRAWRCASCASASSTRCSCGTLVNIRYLTGFTGSNALVLIASGEQAGGHRFYTDFRYATQSAEQVQESFAREILADELIEAAVESLAPEGSTGRLGFDDASLTVARHTHLRELLPDAWELVPCAGAVERLRAVKDEEEIARIRAASELADEALRHILERGLAGRTERDVAIDLELEMRRLGAEGPSFSSIVASGAHGALPHAEPRNEKIPRDVLVTIDWGALHEGYCSDCTRTYATGEHISTRAREIYELVLSAQTQGLAAVRAGPSGVELDAVARTVIEARGLRRALRPRPRARRWPGDPRGSAPVAHSRRRSAARRQHRHGRARRLPAG